MRKIFLTLTLVMLFFARSSLASCTVNGAPPPTVGTMPLQASNITVGPDAQVGTVLLTQTYDLNFQPGGGHYLTVTCTGAGTLMANYSLSSTPLPLASWSQGIQAGKVYQTNVPGIGVWIHQGVYGSAAVPTSKAASIEPNTSPGYGCESGTCTVTGNYKRWDLYFIKTGPITSGTIQGAMLPCVQVNYTNDVNAPQNMISNTCMTGAINVLSNTCVTPDVNVYLGRHDASELQGKGSTTAWVDSSIKLTNCPAFNGYGPAGHWYVDQSGTNSAGTAKQNSLQLSFTPTTTVINSGTGVVSLTSAPNAATGVGIQLAYGTTTSATPVNLGSSNSYAQPLGSSGDVSLPLVARYIQTEDRVTPGSANGTMTFTINYY